MAPVKYFFHVKKHLKKIDKTNPKTSLNGLNGMNDLKQLSFLQSSEYNVGEIEMGGKDKRRGILREA